MNKKPLILILVILGILGAWAISRKASGPLSNSKIIETARTQFRITQEFLTTLSILSNNYSINLWVQDHINTSSRGFVLRSAPFAKIYIAVRDTIPEGKLPGYQSCELLDKKLVIYYNLSGLSCRELRTLVEKVSRDYPGFDLDLILYPGSVQQKDGCLLVYSRNPETGYTIVSLLCSNYTKLLQIMDRMKTFYTKLLGENLSSALIVNGTKAYIEMLYFAPSMKP